MVWKRQLSRFPSLLRLLALVVSLSLRMGSVTSLSAVVTVPFEKDECYMVRTPTSWDEDIQRNPRYIYGNYELISGGGDDEMSAGPLLVYLATFDLKKMLYQSRKGQEHGHFDIEVGAGRKYWFCIANTHREGDDDTPLVPQQDHTAEEGVNRKIGFSLDIVHHDEFDYTDFGGNLIDLEDETSKIHREAKERSQQWGHLGTKLKTKLKDLKRHFDYLRVREADHRAVTEKTFTDILTWTAAEAATVAMVAMGQIFYFRRYLERNKPFSMLG